MEKSGKELGLLTSAKLDVIKGAATLSARETATGDYMLCMLLLLADNERYGPLKTQLDNIFLMEEQEYTSNILAAKRLMTDVVLATGAVKPMPVKILIVGATCFVPM